MGDVGSSGTPVLELGTKEPVEVRGEDQVQRCSVEACPLLCSDRLKREKEELQGSASVTILVPNPIVMKRLHPATNGVSQKLNC